MPDWVWIVGVVVLYIFATQWLLPRLGVPTWASQNHADGSRREAAIDVKESAKGEWSSENNKRPH